MSTFGPIGSYPIASTATDQPITNYSPAAGQLLLGGNIPNLAYTQTFIIPGGAQVQFQGATPTFIPAVRTSWIGIEALHPGVAQGRVSWIGLEVLHTTSSIATQGVVTWMGLEVLNSGAANAQVTWLGVEALHKGAAQSRVSWIGLEVLRTVADRPPDSGFVYLIAA